MVSSPLAILGVGVVVVILAFLLIRRRPQGPGL